MSKVLVHYTTSETAFNDFLNGVNLEENYPKRIEHFDAFCKEHKINDYFYFLVRYTKLDSNGIVVDSKRTVGTVEIDRNSKKYFYSQLIPTENDLILDLLPDNGFEYEPELYYAQVEMCKRNNII